MLTTQEWHHRFNQQARWTEQVRRFLFSELALANRPRGLEVGCGTGVISAEIHHWGAPQVFGIDLRRDFLQMAGQLDPELDLCQSDALRLPFPDASFDFGFCHYFLLWLAEPLRVLQELRRVTHPGCPILLLAEPDYGGRIDYPESLADFGRLQSQTLRRQGADPNIGRKLASLLGSAGLTQVRSGVLGGQWGWLLDKNESASEWKILENDLAGQVSPQTLSEYQQQDTAAWQSGERILYIPTFYAWGIV